ncbi:MAG: rhodanese-like domain-containing protein [Nocardiaceae bacterium]|nr:rhodanese-like domain-containing protein [Nocardiaceae bacterium]
MSDAGFPSVSIDVVPTAFGAEYVLLDVREDDEWQLGHAPGAVHIPIEDVPARLDDVDIDAEIYVICRNGGRSRVVSQFLIELGYDVINVNGGMVAWQSAGREVVTDDGGPGAV